MMTDDDFRTCVPFISIIFQDHHISPHKKIWMCVCVCLCVAFASSPNSLQCSKKHLLRQLRHIECITKLVTTPISISTQDSIFF